MRSFSTKVLYSFLTVSGECLSVLNIFVLMQSCFLFLQTLLPQWKPEIYPLQKLKPLQEIQHIPTVGSLFSVLTLRTFRYSVRCLDGVLQFFSRDIL
jgi:hypothetical protein